MITTHEAWLQRLKAEATTQKTFRVLDPKGADQEVYEVDVTMLPDQGEAGGSSAAKTGYQVSVAYSKAPDNVLFQGTYPSEELAKNMFDDLCTQCAGVEGLIRQTDFEGAKVAMKKLSDVLNSASAQPAVEDTDGGTK